MKSKIIGIIKTFLINEKSEEIGIEVTKKELLFLMKKQDIKILNEDMNFIKQKDENEIVGALFGNLKYFNDPYEEKNDIFFVNIKKLKEI